LQNDVKSLKNPATEADDDGDGVPNNKDLEPNTPKGNLINFQGITIPKVTPATSTTSPATTSSATDIATEKPLFSIYFRVNSDAIDANNKEKTLIREEPAGCYGVNKIIYPKDINNIYILHAIGD
jgi:hypothetical protein